MKKGMVELEKYQELAERCKNNDDYSLGGGQGFCFVNGTKIIKIYNEPKEIYEIDDFSDCFSYRIAFPVFYIYKNEKIYGEVMPYYRAKTLDVALTGRSRLDLFKDNYLDIIEEIKAFPDVAMFDIGYPRNILYSASKGFYLIDTTGWQKWDNQLSDNIRFFNSSIMYVLNKVIFDTTERSMVKRNLQEGYWYLKSSSMGNELLALIESNVNGDYQLLELLDAYKMVVKSYYNYDVETLGDIKKYTKIMKNS